MISVIESKLMMQWSPELIIEFTQLYGHNRLLRQYFPKSKLFEEISENRLFEVETLLNSRPRKVLKYRTPIEVFNELTKKSKIVAL